MAGHHLAIVHVHNLGANLTTGGGHWGRGERRRYQWVTGNGEIRSGKAQEPRGLKGTGLLLPSPLIISSLTALVPALISSAHGLPRAKNAVCVLLLGPPKNSGRTGSVQIDPNRPRLTHGGQSHVRSCPWC